MIKKLSLYCCVFFLPLSFFGQQDSVPYYKNAIRERKLTINRNIINNGIVKKLSLPLDESTEEDWMAAFASMELVRYTSPWVESKVQSAFDDISKRSDEFNRSLVELLYATYKNRFVKEVDGLMAMTKNVKVYASCAAYLLLNKSLDSSKTITNIKSLAANREDSAVIAQLQYHFGLQAANADTGFIKELCQPRFLQNNIVVFSFQRRNRDYPGLAVIRDSTGKFLNDPFTGLFHVPQLARSMSGLPSYLTNGNTPQGIFRMHGFAISTSDAIGRTANIQLTMPFETSLQHFFKDSAITDSVWTKDWYNSLLPGTFKNHSALYESFYAGMAGRTEIIAHGTTLDPNYYNGQPYYPLTPTLGCLCTKETWDETTGRRSTSDQQKLVDALRQAGGANGYYVVIELNDEQRPVTIDDIQHLIHQ